MHQSISLIFLSGIIIVCCFCKKPTDDNSRNYIASFPTSVKEWYCYKPGSFWIYKNDSTNELDSLVVDAASIIMNDPNSLYPTEVLFVRYKPNGFLISYEKMSARSVCSGGCALNFNGVSQLYVFPGFICPEDTVGQVFNSYDNNQNLLGYRKIFRFYPKFTTVAGEISNVYIIQVEDFNLNRTMFFYIARQYGIVKIEVVNSSESSTWSLNQIRIIQ